MDCRHRPLGRIVSDLINDCNELSLFFTCTFSFSKNDSSSGIDLNLLLSINEGSFSEKEKKM